jgi:hypothetical protein
MASCPVVRTRVPALADRLTNSHERFCFGIDLETGDAWLDSLRRRLAAAARRAVVHVRVGDFEAADAAVLAIDRDIQAAVMLGAMYTSELGAAIANGDRASRPAFVAALHERALRWRQSAYPEPHTADEADANASGREADRAALAALLAD